MSAEHFRDQIELPNERVIVALDGMDWDTAEDVMQEVGGHVGMAKANALAQKQGWLHAINTLSGYGAETMADQKYKDIPATMENHLREITSCGPKLITIFADNSKSALEAAVKGRDSDGSKEGFAGILGVTVLTSINKEECVSIYGDDPENKVLQFASTALEAGLDGIVCSGKELKALRRYRPFDGLLAVVPGITPEWAKKADDQSRVVTPHEALQEGADFIVVGRAITKPPVGVSRAEAAQRIAQELAEA